MSIRVILVEEQTLVREALQCALSDEAELEVEGVPCAPPPDQKADVLLLSWRAPDCLALLQETRARNPVLALTQGLDSQELRQLVRLGVSGVVDRESRLTELVDAIRALAAGQQYFCRRATVALATLAAEPPVQLTARERELLQASARGLSVRDAAEALRLSPKTLEKHRGRLLRKFKCSFLHEAVQRARVCGSL